MLLDQNINTANDLNGKQSVQYMTVLGKIEKTGYLMKQSKILGRFFIFLI
jgi:hypothetical protein